jgi:flagellar assembly factor FliW
MLLSEISYEETMVTATKEKKNENIITVQSRFGDLTVDQSKAIFFPNGIYGFPENLHFVITSFPNPALDKFQILQCLNDHSISFPILMAGYENNVIDEKDMQNCLNDVEVTEENFGMMFILSSQKNSEGKFEVYANTKAPLVIDTSLKIGIQYVFTNSKYSLKQKISE